MLNKEMFPRIIASGTAYEIGLAHGKEAKTQVSVSIETYKAMFMDYSHINWEKACKYAMTFVPLIEEYDADYLEEIRGISDGSGYSFEEILALNVRSEIVLQGEQIDRLLSDGCTSFDFTSDLMKNGRLYIGQNWDWKKSQQNGCVILHVKQKSKPNITMVTEAGIIGKIGFNSAGIGVALNALSSNVKVSGKTIPLHIALRGILDSHTLSDAIRAVTTTNLSCCAHFMLASANGEGISLEVGPGDFDALYAEEGFLAHTNHFITPRFNQVNDTSRITFPDSFLRLGRIRSLTKKLNGHVDVTSIKKLMRDHISYPDSICRHEDTLEPEGKRVCTVFSIIMDLEREEMLFAPGTPCCTEYHLVKF